jgi:hypothetical protein
MPASREEIRAPRADLTADPRRAARRCYAGTEEISMANSRRTRRAGLFLLLGAVSLSAVGCAGTTISRILAEPQRYTRRGDVRLNGDVVESMSFLGHGAYKLDDGTGTIWVISNHGVPRRGARVKVHGRIRDVVDVSTIMRLPEQIGSGLVMTDAYHRGR